MHTTQESDFGKRLELVRCWMDMTQAQFSCVLHCAPSTISAYEDLRRAPTTKQVREMSQILGIPFEWLCGLGPTFAFELQNGNISTDRVARNGKME